MTDSSDSSSSATAQMEFSQLFYNAKHHHVDALQSLQTRIAKQFATYDAEVTKLREERDTAVQARTVAEAALQRANQQHTLDRHEWESQLKIAQESSAHAEQDAERARAEVKVARADTQDLRAECSQLRNQIASNLTDVKDTIKVYTKWAYELAVTTGVATEASVASGQPSRHTSRQQSASSNRANRSPPPQQHQHQSHKTASTSRARGTPAPTSAPGPSRGRTVTAVFEVPVKQEDDAMNVPAKRKRPTPPPSGHGPQQRTPRPTNEPTTPQSGGEQRAKRRHVVDSDDELSDDQLMIIAAPSPNKGKRPVTGSAKQTPRRAPGAVQPARPHTSTSRRRDDSEDEEYRMEDPVEEDDDDEEEDDGVGRTKSGSPKRRKLGGGTPFPGSTKKRR